MALTPIGNVVLLLHCDDSSGSTLTDSSLYGLHGACKGTAATSAAQSMFGGRSLLTGNANGNYAAVGTNQLLDFGTGDFTIELFLSPVSQGADGGAILGRWNGTAKDFLLMRGGDASLQVYLNGAQVLQTSAGDLPTSGFTHVALTRQSGTLNAWIGGINKGAVSFPGAIAFTRGTPIYIGQSNLVGGATWLQAYFDDIRITVGAAQYTANFTPPSSPLATDSTVDPYVTSVLHMDGANGSAAIMDQGGASWTAVGNARISTAQSKFGGTSCAFGGNGALVFSLAPDVPVTVIAGTLRRKWTLEGSAKASPAATRFITGTLVLRTVQAVHGSIYYDNSVWRGLGVAPVTGFDRASPANAAKASSFEQADNLGAFPSAPWNSSVAVDALASGVHEQAQHLEGAAAGVFEAGVPLADERMQGWRYPPHIKVSKKDAWEEAAQYFTAHGDAWEYPPHVRVVKRSSYDEAVAALRSLIAPARQGTKLRRTSRAPWEEAKWAPFGHEVPIIPPEAPLPPPASAAGDGNHPAWQVRAVRRRRHRARGAGANHCCRHRYAGSLANHWSGNPC